MSLPPSLQDTQGALQISSWEVHFKMAESKKWFMELALCVVY